MVAAQARGASHIGGARGRLSGVSQTQEGQALLRLVWIQPPGGLVVMKGGEGASILDRQAGGSFTVGHDFRSAGREFCSSDRSPPPDAP
jgi:hypothetical protein